MVCKKFFRGFTQFLFLISVLSIFLLNIGTLFPLFITFKTSFCFFVHEKFPLLYAGFILLPGPDLVIFGFLFLLFFFNEKYPGHEKGRKNRRSRT